MFFCFFVIFEIEFIIVFLKFFIFIYEFSEDFWVILERYLFAWNCVIGDVFLEFTE